MGEIARDEVPGVAPWMQALHCCSSILKLSSVCFLPMYLEAFRKAWRPGSGDLSDQAFLLNIVKMEHCLNRLFIIADQILTRLD